MKKFLSIFIVLTIIAFTFTACNQVKKDGINSSSDNSSSSSSDILSSSSDDSSSSGSSSSSSSSASSSSSSSSSVTVSTVGTKTSSKIVATVTSSVASGSYSASRYVQLKDATSGATIYYTTNGSDPTTSSTKYTSPFVVSRTSTIKAFAVAYGLAKSAVASFTYTINVPTKLSGDITSDGSTALQPLLTAITPLFENKYSSAFKGSIAIGGGGSGTGLNDVESGVVKIGDSDVTVAQAGKNMSDLVDHEVCTVGVAAVVSSNVNLSSITPDTLLKIFNGTIKNWQDVPGYSGSDHSINVIYRKSGSGTRILFETYGLGLTSAQQATFTYASGATTAMNSPDVKTDLNSAPYSIGYETIPYTDGLKRLNINFGSGAVACNYTNINNGSYKIWGYEHMYTKGQPSATIKAFIDFITSADSISTIKNNGYGLISDLQNAALALGH